jgi:glycosyltransferase involved in cell wall biosynthesis
VLGKIKPDKVADYYNKAAIFCLPTLREPFGIVFVEAMHYKLPIVANNIGSIPDMVINDFNGYLIDNNVDEYADQICKLLDNPEKCKRLGETGYTYSQSKFRWALVTTAKNLTINIKNYWQALVILLNIVVSC